MKDDCGNCVFYRDSSRADYRSGYGVCRRYPEHVDTNDGRWCGEHKAADAETRKSEG